MSLEFVSLGPSKLATFGMLANDSNDVYTPDFNCLVCMHKLLVGYWCFAPWQYLKSYQERYCLVTVCTHGNLLVCAPLGSQTTSMMTRYRTPKITLSQKWAEPTSSYPILIMLSTWLGSDKYLCLNRWFDSCRGHRNSTHSAIPSGHRFFHMLSL